MSFAAFTAMSDTDNSANEQPGPSESPQDVEEHISERHGQKRRRISQEDEDPADGEVGVEQNIICNRRDTYGKLPGDETSMSAAAPPPQQVRKRNVNDQLGRGGGVLRIATLVARLKFSLVVAVTLGADSTNFCAYIRTLALRPTMSLMSRAKQISIVVSRT